MKVNYKNILAAFGLVVLIAVLSTALLPNPYSYIVGGFFAYFIGCYVPIMETK